MRTYGFVTVDVFTDRRFGGNPLAVFPDAGGLSDGEMQSLAAEFNLSETTFVVPPADPANTARVRIFNRTSEMPFAGHPNVGTGWVLAGLGRDRDGVLRFEEIAGLVEVNVARSGGGNQLRAVTIAAPQPLSLGAEMPAELLAGCASLDASDVVVSAHRPVVASVGNSFVIAEVAAAALARATPDISRFRSAVEAFRRSGPAACRSTSMPGMGRTRDHPSARPDVLATVGHDRRCGHRQRGDAARRPPSLAHQRTRTTLRHHARRRNGPARACSPARPAAPSTASAPASAAAACRC